MISVDQARQIVLDTFLARKIALKTERVPLSEALGRVLAQAIVADADVPAFNRSVKDGFAVRSADIRSVPVTLRVAGESRAGDAKTPVLAAGEAIQIMTGAAVPSGADAVVMVEDTERADSASRENVAHSFGAGTIRIVKSLSEGANISFRGSEARCGEELSPAGTRMRVHEISLAASVGLSVVEVFARPRVAILATGDELVSIDAAPASNQIRNSNSSSLAALVRQAYAGCSHELGIARDDPADLRKKVEQALNDPSGCECLLLTGGVSAGKYDFVEPVLKDLGVVFHFDSIAIRPGKPAVFGTRGNQFVFALPGNPVSTIVTFQLFVLPLLGLLSGTTAGDSMILNARLENSFRQPTGRRGYLPAYFTLRQDSLYVRTVRWKGSSDLAGLARSNCLLIAPENQAEFTEGSTVQILMA
ncbi:MAG: molybdopterin molybdotransferase MoeA [Acidobacteriia bacterium]|nr:molybdopterin molybdotransferase MoeA [Terriglobia bacterium]